MSPSEPTSCLDPSPRPARSRGQHLTPHLERAGSCCSVRCFGRVYRSSSGASTVPVFTRRLQEAFSSRHDNPSDRHGLHRGQAGYRDGFERLRKYDYRLLAAGRGNADNHYRRVALQAHESHPNPRLLSSHASLLQPRHRSGVALT